MVVQQCVLCQEDDSEGGEKSQVQADRGARQIEAKKRNICDSKEVKVKKGKLGKMSQERKEDLETMFCIRFCVCVVYCCIINSISSKLHKLSCPQGANNKLGLQLGSIYA
jgi:hypothetical protein